MSDCIKIVSFPQLPMAQVFEDGRVQIDWRLVKLVSEQEDWSQRKAYALVLLAVQNGNAQAAQYYALVDEGLSA